MTSQFRDQFDLDVDIARLETARAQRMVQVVKSGVFDGVRFVGCVSDCQGLEAVVVDLSVPLGQKDVVNDIRNQEPIAVVFGSTDILPQVYPLRDNFPFHLPHVNVALKHLPRSLCLSDQPIEQQISDYTAIKMLRRAQWWLERSAYGQLHGDEQPLDPMFVDSQIQIIVDKDVISANHVIGRYTSSHENSPIRLYATSQADLESDDFTEEFCNFIAVDTLAVSHGALNWVPTNLKQLVEVYGDSGVDIREQLMGKLKEIAYNGVRRNVLAARLVMLLSTEIATTEGRKYLQRKAYLSNVSTGELGAALGIFERTECGGWGLLLDYTAPDETCMENIQVFGSDLNFNLTRDSAAQYSNLDDKDVRKVTLIGAGAVGSHFSLSVARAGLGEWHIIDNDFLLPHNLARHALDPSYLGSAKAEANANVIRMLLQDKKAAIGYVRRIGDDGIQEDLVSAFDDTSEIVDASASVSLARRLASYPEITSPVTSIFFTPSGDDGVMLSEDVERSTKLDCVEHHYYWMVASSPMLERHIHQPGKSIPIGGCRTPSARIAETQVGLLSSVIAGRWVQNRRPSSAQVNIWCGSDDWETINHISECVPDFLTVKVADWVINVSSQVLERIVEIKLDISPKETGGIVVGAWDKVRKVGYVVGVFDAPADSRHSELSFVRGFVGVYKTITNLESLTLGNLTYVGEWHSHPPGASSNASEDDLLLLSWVNDNVEPFEAPPLMIIAADEGYRILCQIGTEIFEVLIDSDLSTNSVE